MCEEQSCRPKVSGDGGAGGAPGTGGSSAACGAAHGGAQWSRDPPEVYGGDHIRAGGCT